MTIEEFTGSTGSDFDTAHGEIINELHLHIILDGRSRGGVETLDSPKFADVADSGLEGVADSGPQALQSVGHVIMCVFHTRFIPVSNVIIPRAPHCPFRIHVFGQNY